VCSIPSRTCASTPSPEAGAQCGSAARWDLCGGPPERAVPTAILTSAVTNGYGSSSGLNPTDLSLLKNKKVIEVDRDSIDASRISDVGTAQVFGKVERNGSGIVGLFDTNTNLTAANNTISTTASAIGLPNDSRGYKVQELWTGKRSRITSDGRITASVPSEGVALYRVTPLTHRRSGVPRRHSNSDLRGIRPGGP